jgi:Chalcone isomerase-like
MLDSAPAFMLQSAVTQKPLVRKALGVLVLYAAALMLPLPAAANEAAPHIRAHIPDATLVGAGRYTWFAFHIYDGTLYAPASRYAAGRPFALELAYARALKGADIAQRSIDEIARLGIGSDAERAAWLPVLTKLLPDVRENDRLTGVALGLTAPFYFNGRAIGEISDAKLVQAFFAIWLDERTSAPGFRRRLLGLDP